MGGLGGKEFTGVNGKLVEFGIESISGLVNGG